MGAELAKHLAVIVVASLIRRVDPHRAEMDKTHKIVAVHGLREGRAPRESHQPFLKVLALPSK